MRATHVVRVVVLTVTVFPSTHHLVKLSSGVQPSLSVMATGGRPSKRPKLIQHPHRKAVNQTSTRHHDFSLQANGKFSLQTSYLSTPNPAVIEGEEVPSQHVPSVDPWNETLFSQEIDTLESHFDGSI